MNVVDVRGLAFAYPGGEPVLDGLDFAVEEGEIFGFLGPNGSGKTTTQKILARLLHGYRGQVTAFGSELSAQGPAFYEQIGVSFEFPNLYSRLTAAENLDFYRAFFDGETDGSEPLLERLDLPRGDKRPVSQYSKGMKMRVVLARSLVNRPRLWFLDEPTSGQDPPHAVAIRELIREKAQGGAAVFLTTHDMSVAESLCDRVAFLSAGRIAATDDPASLRRAHARRSVRVEIDGGGGLETREFSLDRDTDREALAELVRNERIETIHSTEPSLEDVFLAVTGRRLDGG
jgi:fluoroquinolone transport system ATP-binding protein